MNKADMPWITENGVTEDAAALVKRVAAAEDRIVAYFVDGFQSGYANRLDAILDRQDGLLELRMFSETRELWLHRSRLGVGFFWRIASEEQLPEPARYCFETRQLLDLGEAPDETPTFENGLRVLRSSGGGCFLLPISGEDRFIRIMNYVTYDPDGVANAADYRLIGFTKEGKSNVE